MTFFSTGEIPDCSGRLGLSWNLDPHVVAVPRTTSAVNLKHEHYDLIYDLPSMGSQTFKLRHFPVLTGSHGTVAVFFTD